MAREDWVDKQEQNLLNCRYFHTVFTVPPDLRQLFYQNQDVCYGILHKAVSETIKELCADTKHLGAKPGVTSIMHTWGQNLSFHPHIHCIITGGGLTEFGTWKHSSKKFFLPVRILSKKFRGKLLYYLKKANLSFFGGLKGLEEPARWESFLCKQYDTAWVVYCKKPFGDASKVLRYLGRYTHRVAISNNRIESLSDGLVTFQWRDYSDSNKSKLMTLTADEFIRRFLMHVLPKGFRKIRHVGIFAARDKKQRLELCRRLTRTRIKVREPETTLEKLTRIFGQDFNLCPSCKSGHMIRGAPCCA